MPRSFSRSDWEASLRAWSEGDFSEEWRPYRHQAAMKGMIFPPDGTNLDSWDDDRPSQRAIIIRAIRETPGVLRQAIDRSKNWSEVIAYVLRRRDEFRAQMNDREADELRDRDAYAPTPRQASAAIAEILGRIADSSGVVLVSGQRSDRSLTDDESPARESSAAGS
jgi:hypothetical protein